MSEKQQNWYVLRDLKRHNSNTPAYLELRNQGFEVFTGQRIFPVGGDMSEYSVIFAK